MEFDIPYFYKMRAALDVFKQRDLQSTVTILNWLQINSYTVDELRVYVNLYGIMESVSKLGYFQPTPDVDLARRIKLFEKDLPLEVRRQLRQLRLVNAKYGKEAKG